MELKYRITNECYAIGSLRLYRIQALKDFDKVKAGDLGGFVESSKNLSQEGLCWISENAKVSGNAEVLDNAYVYGDARIFDNAVIYGDAQVSGYTFIFDNAQVYSNALVFGNSRIRGNAKVFGNAVVFGEAKIQGNAKVYGNAQVSGDVCVANNVKIYGEANVFGDAYIRGDAVIQSNNDYMVFKNCVSSGRYFTYTFSDKKWSVGCFYGNSDELLEKAKKDGEVVYNFYKMCVDFVKKLEDSRQP